MSGEASKINGRKGGRPKGTNAIKAEEAKAYIIRRVTEELKPIIDKQIALAKNGDNNARKDLLDRAFGRPTETVEQLGRVTLIMNNER
jgi:hypothetical protein